MDEKLTLALDTCFQAGGVAIARGDELLAELMFNTPATHSRRLLSCMDYLLEQIGASKQDLGTIAVTLGPGFFTGLRIGVATAQGLALGLGLDMAGVSSLRLLALGITGYQGKIWAVADARRGLVYAAPFERRGDELTRLGDDTAYSPARLAEELNEPALLVGAGARLYWDEFAKPEMHLAPAEADLPRPGMLALEGSLRLSNGNLQDPAMIKPHYCRPSDAEIKFGLPMDDYRLVE